MTTHPITCACCRAPIAELVRGADGVVRLVIVARHHSNRHTNTLTLEQLETLFVALEQDVNRE